MNAEAVGVDRTGWTAVHTVLARGLWPPVADDYLDKSPSAGRMGKAVEYLVAASCILTTRGELNVSTSLVDDEGMDPVFNRRNSSATLAVQVKSRTSDSKRVKAGTFLAFVRSRHSALAPAWTSCSWRSISIRPW